MSLSEKDLCREMRNVPRLTPEEARINQLIFIRDAQQKAEDKRLNRVMR